MAELNRSGDKVVSEKFFYIEPNEGFGDERNAPVPLENLTLCVDLTVEYQRKKEGNLFVQGEKTNITFRYNAVNTGENITFLRGSNFEGEQWLSTEGYGNYTFDLIQNKGTSELFGIESINISYNNYMVPVVVINFIDIKGAALHGAEEIAHNSDSEFVQNASEDLKFLSCFFTIPFPRFNLTIKGYYGKPVTYDLSCYEFKTALDSKSGNFTGVATMIGYSFALISDVSICSLMSAPYSNYYGRKYWKEQVENGRFKFKNGADFLTTEQIIATWNNNMHYVSQAIEDSLTASESALEVSLQTVQNKINQKTESIRLVKQCILSVKETFEELRRAIMSDGGEGNYFDDPQEDNYVLDYHYFADAQCVVAITEGFIMNIDDNPEDIEIQIPKIVDRTVNGDVWIEEFKKEGDFTLESNYILGNELGKNREREAGYFINQLGIKENFSSNQIMKGWNAYGLNEKMKNPQDRKKFIEMHNFLVNRLKDSGLEDLTFDDGEKAYWDKCFDINTKLKAIIVWIFKVGGCIESLEASIKEDLRQQQQILKQKKDLINATLTKVLGFLPTIENITKIFFAHLETFLYMFECVRVNRSHDTSKVLKEIGIFPQRYETIIENNIYKKVETWIGVTYPDLEEVQMVKGFLSGFETVVGDMVLPVGISLKDLEYNCIAPCDIIAWQNPFEICGDDGALTEKVLMSRVMDLFLMGLNRYNCNPEIMGALDAQNYARLYPRGNQDLFKELSTGTFLSEVKSQFKIGEGVLKKEVNVVVKDLFNTVFYQISGLYGFDATKQLEDKDCKYFHIYDNGEFDGVSMLSVVKGKSDKSVITINTSPDYGKNIFSGWQRDETESCFRFQWCVNSYTAFIVKRIDDKNAMDKMERQNIAFNWGSDYTAVAPDGDICNCWKTPDGKLHNRRNRMGGDSDDRFVTISTNDEAVTFMDTLPNTPKIVFRTLACLRHMNPLEYTILTIPGFDIDNKNNAYVCKIENGTLFRYDYYKDTNNIYYKALLFLMTFYWGRDYGVDNWRNEILKNEKNGYQEYRNGQGQYNKVASSHAKNNNLRYYRNIARCLMFEEDSVIQGEDFRYMEVVPLFYVLKLGGLLYAENDAKEGKIVNCHEKIRPLITSYIHSTAFVDKEIKSQYRQYLIDYFKNWVNKVYSRWDKVFIRSLTETAVGNPLYYLTMTTNSKTIDFFRETNELVREITESFFKLVVWYKYNYAIVNYNKVVSSIALQLTKDASSPVYITASWITSGNLCMKDMVDSYLTKFEAGLREIFADSMDQYLNEALSLPNCDLDNGLSTYKYFGQLWDRWIINKEYNGYDAWTLERVFDEKSGRIHFIDSSYNSIGNLALVDLAKLVELLQTCKQQGQMNLPFLSFLSYFYRDNHCTLYNIQNFYNNQDAKNVSEIFTPIPYMDIQWNEVKHNSDIVVMYTYQLSESLEDSFNIVPESHESLPAQLQMVSGNYHIPAIGVTYGAQNQNYFIDINVSTNTPTVTEQTLQSLMKIADENSRTASQDTGAKIRTYGQDTWQIYGNYAYECTVKMLGCPWIQPLMYFQLLNVPLFRGAYIIQKVEHSLQNGQMFTTFSGMRVSSKVSRQMARFSLEQISQMRETVEELTKYEYASFDNDCPYIFYNPYDEGEYITYENYVVDIRQFFDKTVKKTLQNGEEIVLTNWEIYALVIYGSAYEIEKKDAYFGCACAKKFCYLFHNYWVRFKDDDSFKTDIALLFNRFFGVDYGGVFFDYGTDYENLLKLKTEEETKDYIPQIQELLNLLFSINSNLTVSDDEKRVDGFIPKTENTSGTYIEIFNGAQYGGNIFIKGAYSDGQCDYFKKKLELDSQVLDIKMVFNAIKKSINSTPMLKNVQLSSKSIIDDNEMLCYVENKKESNDVYATVYDLIVQTYGKWLGSVTWMVKDENSGHKMWDSIYICVKNKNSNANYVNVAYITNESTLAHTNITSYDNLHENFYMTLMKRYGVYKNDVSEQLTKINWEFSIDAVNFASLIGDNDEWEKIVLDFFNTNEITKQIVVKPCNIVMGNQVISQDKREKIEINIPESGKIGELYQFTGNNNQTHFTQDSESENQLQTHCLPLYIQSTNKTQSTNVARTISDEDEIEMLLLRNGMVQTSTTHGSMDMENMMRNFGKKSYVKKQGEAHGCAGGVREKLRDILKMKTTGAPSYASGYIYALDYWGFTAIYQGMPADFIGPYIDGDIIVSAGLTTYVNMSQDSIRDLFKKEGKYSNLTSKEFDKKVRSAYYSQFGHIQIHYNGKWYCDREYINADVYTPDRYCYIFRGIDKNSKVNNSYGGSKLVYNGDKVYWGDEFIYTVAEGGKNWQPSSNIINQIKEFEGFRSQWYYEPDDTLSIGYGFNETPQLKTDFPVDEDKIGKEDFPLMTKEYANEYMENEVIPKLVNSLKLIMDKMMYYNQNQMDALFCLIYNIGEPAFKQRSPKLLEGLRTRNIDKICEEMNHGWNMENAEGIRKRRRWERKLFKTALGSFPTFGWNDKEFCD